MLIVCWPLLSAVPRPYIRSPSITIFHGDRPGAPLLVLAADHVAVAVGQHGRLGRILDPAGDQERAVFGARIGQHGAVVAELRAATRSSRPRHIPAGPASSRSPGWWWGSPPAAAAPRGSRRRRNTSLRARWRHPVCRSCLFLGGLAATIAKYRLKGGHNADIGPRRFHRHGGSPLRQAGGAIGRRAGEDTWRGARVPDGERHAQPRDRRGREGAPALGNKCVGTFDRMPAHSPRSAIIAATAQAREARADLIVTLGGGSITDGAKAVQLCLANDITTRRGHGQDPRARRREAADGAPDLDPHHALGRRVLRHRRRHQRGDQGEGAVPPSPHHPAGRDPRSRGDAPHADVAVPVDRHPRRRSLRRGRVLQRIDGVHQRLGPARPVAAGARPAPGEGRPDRHEGPARLPDRLVALDGRPRGRRADGRQPRHRLRAGRGVRRAARPHLLHHAAVGDALEQIGQRRPPGADRQRHGPSRRGRRRRARPVHPRPRHAAKPFRGEDRQGAFRPHRHTRRWARPGCRATRARFRRRPR